MMVLPDNVSAERLFEFRKRELSKIMLACRVIDFPVYMHGHGLGAEFFIPEHQPWGSFYPGVVIDHHLLGVMMNFNRMPDMIKIWGYNDDHQRDFQINQKQDSKEIRDMNGFSVGRFNTGPLVITVLGMPYGPT